MNLSLWFSRAAQPAWILFAYGLGLWLYSVPLTGDQRVYIATAMEMWEKGTWFQPFLFGEPSYIKPPLQYWMTLLGWSVFGFNLFGALIPAVLAVIGTAWMLVDISKSFGIKERETQAGVWFAATAGAVTFGTTAQMEIWVVLSYTASWWAALKYLSSKNTKWLYAAFAVAGLAALIKSPLYSVFWVLSYWLYLFITKQWREYFRLHHFLALFLGILVGLSWFIFILLYDGDRFWNQYILYETLSKSGWMTSGLGKVWVALASYSVPLLLFSIPAVMIWGSRPFKDKKLKFLLAWSVIPAIFFSSFPYRLGVYLFILLPAVVLAIDWAHAQDQSNIFRLIGRVMAVLFIIFGFSIGGFLLQTGLVGLAVSVGFIITALICARYSWRMDWHLLAYGCLFFILFFRLAAVSFGESDIAGLRQYMDKNPSKKIAMLDEERSVWHEVGLLSVATTQPIKRFTDRKSIKSWLKAGNAIVVSQDQWMNLNNSVLAGTRVKTKNWMRLVKRRELNDMDLFEDSEVVRDRNWLLKRRFKIVWSGK